jgi:hypothetical protein
LKTATELKAKIRNVFALTGIPPHIIQRQFFFERFLERVYLSNYDNAIIIKDAILQSSLMGLDLRTTIDLDQKIVGNYLMTSEIINILNNIISINLDDTTDFILTNII